MLGVVATIALATAACASAPANVATGEGGPADQIEAVSASPAAIALASAEDGRVLVVEGGARYDGGSPRPVVTVWQPGEATSERFDLPISQPLFNVAAWWTGSELAVVGLRCPRWTDESGVPDLFGGENPSISTLCGSDSYLVGTWDPATVDWKQLSSVDLTADGVVVASTAGGRAVVQATRVGENGAPLYQATSSNSVIDVEQGRLLPAPESPAPAGDADAEFVSCLAPGGDLSGLLVWDGPTPPALKDNGWSESMAVVATPSSGRPQHQLVLAAEGDRWTPIPTTGRPVASTSRPACSSRGFVVADGSASATIDPAGGSATIEPASGLPEAAGQVVVQPSLNLGGEPLAFVMAPPEEENPDDLQQTATFALDGNRWSSHGHVGFSQRWRGLLVEDQVVGLVPDGTSEIDEAVRIEVS